MFCHYQSFLHEIQQLLPNLYLYNQLHRLEVNPNQHQHELLESSYPNQHGLKLSLLIILSFNLNLRNKNENRQSFCCLNVFELVHFRILYKDMARIDQLLA
jgi:hypothetical protein